MTLDMSFVGQRIDPLEFAYAAKDTIRYALGVGAKAAELDFLYEGRGPKVIPSFALHIQHWVALARISAARFG